MATFFQRHPLYSHLPDPTCFITFRLAGSLPLDVVARLKAEYEEEHRLARQFSGKALYEARYRAQKRPFARVGMLDRALYGPHWLVQRE